MSEISKEDKPAERYVVRSIEGQVPYVRIEVNQYGHVCWRQTSPDSDLDSVNFPVHRLLAIAEFGTEAVKDAVVHHSNHIPWDNRPENIELMSPEEHAAHHSGPVVSDRELLDDLRAGAAVLGATPTTSDVREFGEYGVSTYRKRFGSFVQALREAGLQPRESQLAQDGQ